MKIRSRFYSLSTAIISLSFLITSCGLSDELDKLNSIDTIEAKGSFSANLLNQTWLLKDIIPTDKLNLKESSDGTYKLDFETFSKYQIENANFPPSNIEVNNIDLSILNLSSEYNSQQEGAYFEMPPISTNFEISKPEIANTEISDDFKIQEIKLKQGAKIILNTNITNSNTDVIYKVTFPTLTKNNIPYSRTFPAISGSQNIQYIMGDIDDYILNTDPNIPILISLQVKKTATPITGNINTDFSIVLGNNNEYVKGFFGETVVYVDPVEVPISMSDLIIAKDDSQITAKEAIVSISVKKNNFTIPTDLDLADNNLCYYKGDNQGKPINLIKIPDSDPDFLKFKIKDINLSNIEKLVLKPKITLNKGLASGENILTDNSFVDYDINTEVPFDFTVQNLVFEEEADNPFEGLSLDSDDFQITDGKVLVRGSVISELPLGATLQAYYRNASNDDTYLSPLFDSPITINSGTTKFETVITKEKLDVIKQYPFQTIQLILNGTGAVMSTQKVTFKVGVAIKGSFTGKIN